MERVVVIVSGRVQRVGYRDLVQDVARMLSVVGCVENLLDGNVRVVAEADKETLARFVEEIKVKKDFIDVEGVSVKYGRAGGKFKFFKIKYGSVQGELGERMGAAVTYLGGTNAGIAKGNRMLGGKIDDVGADIKSLNDNMIKRFDVLDVKYGSISQNIERFIEQAGKNQERSEKNVEKLMERMDRNFDRMVVQQEAFTEAITGLTGALLKISERKA
jgi:acylphosphatase